MVMFKVIACAALLFSQNVAATKTKLKLPFAAEQDLIDEIESREKIFWEIAKPLAEAGEQYKKIIASYMPPKYKDLTRLLPNNVFKKYHPGIMEEFIDDNARLFDMLLYTEYINAIFPVPNEITVYSKIAGHHKWRTAYLATRRVWQSVTEALHGIHSFIAPGNGDMKTIIRVWMDHFRARLPFDVTGEFSELLKKHKTNDQWMKWARETYLTSLAQPAAAWPAPNAALDKNPNSEKYFKWVYAKELLKSFGTLLHQGLEQEGKANQDQDHDDWEGDMYQTRLLKNLNGRDGVMTSFDTYRNDPRPENFPLRALMKEIHPRLNPKGKDRIISDLLRMGLNEDSDFYHRFGNPTAAKVSDEFERRATDAGVPPERTMDEVVKDWREWWKRVPDNKWSGKEDLLGVHSRDGLDTMDDRLNSVFDSIANKLNFGPRPQEAVGTRGDARGFTLSRQNGGTIARQVYDKAPSDVYHPYHETTDEEDDGGEISDAESDLPAFKVPKKKVPAKKMPGYVRAGHGRLQKEESEGLQQPDSDGEEFGDYQAAPRQEGQEDEDKAGDKAGEQDEGEDEGEDEEDEDDDDDYDDESAGGDA